MKPNLRFKRAATLVCVALLLAACTRNNSQPQTAAQNRVLTAPTGASVVAEPEDGQWTMAAKNYASTRFSGLEDINTSNVASLKLAWSFSTGAIRGHEAAPIVVNNTMYVITPYPNIVYALDLHQPGGRVKWKYESNPASSSQGVACCDYDAVNDQILMDLSVNGQMRKVLVRPERNGHVYVMDRTNGQVLSANPFGYITSSHGVDLNTGRIIYNEAKKPEVGKVVREICPASPGMKDWQPSALSPRTGLVYIPHQNLCMDFEGLEGNYIAGTPYVGANVRMYAGPGGHRGVFMAWDPVKNEKVWSINENFPVWSGTMATAGDGPWGIAL